MPSLIAYITPQSGKLPDRPTSSKFNTGSTVGQISKHFANRQPPLHLSFVLLLVVEVAFHAQAAVPIYRAIFAIMGEILF